MVDMLFEWLGPARTYQFRSEPGNTYNIVDVYPWD